MSAGGKGSTRRPGEISDDRWDAVFKKKAAIPPTNKRHDLDQALVARQVEKKIAEHERRRAAANKMQRTNVALYHYQKAKGDDVSKTWTREPTLDWFNRVYDAHVNLEREHYSKVRVIELPKEGHRFILVYGDTDDATVTHGTGPFEKLEQAIAWYLNGGR